MSKINCKISLKESKISSSYEFFHKVIENIFFFKWMYFKNRPRSSFLLVRSALINTMVFGTYYLIFSHINFILLGVEVEPVLLYTGCVSVSYWVMGYTFSQKTNYLSTLYNEIIKLQISDKETANILACSFSAQLLTMDLWGHRLYSWILADTLEKSAAWYIETQPQNGVFSSFEEFVKTTNSGNLEISFARDMLLSYQHHLTGAIESTPARHLSVVNG